MGKPLTDKEAKRRLEIWRTFLALCLSRNSDFMNQSTEIYSESQSDSIEALLEKSNKLNVELERPKGLGEFHNIPEWRSKLSRFFLEWETWPFKRGLSLEKNKKFLFLHPIQYLEENRPSRFFPIMVDVLRRDRELKKAFDSWLKDMRRIYEIPEIPMQSLLTFEKESGEVIDDNYLGTMFRIYDLRSESKEPSAIVKTIWPEYFENPKQRWPSETYSPRLKFGAKIRSKEAHVERVFKFCKLHIDQVKNYLKPIIQPKDGALGEIIKLPYLWPKIP